MERARQMSERAIKLESNNATYLDTYAWILYYMGELEEARTYMRQALSLDRTGSAELPLHYGDILFALGERFMAETYWRKALEQGADAKRIEQRITIPKDTPKGTRIEDIIKE
jgi:tetratricopeptide (TPR) repeat protein